MTRKGNIGNTDRKGSNTTLFADDMVIYVENPKESSKTKQKQNKTKQNNKKLLELIRDYSRWQDTRLIYKLLSYILAMNNWNLKLSKQYRLQ